MRDSASSFRIAASPQLDDSEDEAYTMYGEDDGDWNDTNKVSGAISIGAYAAIGAITVIALGSVMVLLRRSRDHNAGRVMPFSTSPSRAATPGTNQGAMSNWSITAGGQQRGRLDLSSGIGSSVAAWDTESGTGPRRRTPTKQAVSQSTFPVGAGNVDLW